MRTSQNCVSSYGGVSLQLWKFRAVHAGRICNNSPKPLTKKKKKKKKKKHFIARLWNTSPTGHKLSWRGISTSRRTICICRVGIEITNKRNDIKQGRLGSGCASAHIHVDNVQFYLLCCGFLSTEWELLNQNLRQKYRESIFIHRLTCDRNILLMSLILSTLVTLVPVIRFALRLRNLAFHSSRFAQNPR